MKTWQKSEISFLKKNYSIKGASFCASKLNRTIESVRIKANRLNLNRDGDSRYNRKKTKNGYTYCFGCDSILPDNCFYKKKNNSKYGKKSNLCKVCCQDKSRNHYHKSSQLERLHNNPEKTIFLRAKTRAKRKGIEFNIEIPDIKIPKICPILGLEIKPFSSSDNSPSLDRINPNLGYIKGNIQVISQRANLIKSNATIKEIELLYNWITSYQTSSSTASQSTVSIG